MTSPSKPAMAGLVAAMQSPVTSMQRTWLIATVALFLLGGAAPRGQSPFDSGTPARPGNRIDELVFARLKGLGIQPAPLCSDAVFLRRAHLDLIGTLPTADEARAFLADTEPNKRGALVDRLLTRDEYADLWAMRWSDALRVKSEFPINLWPNAVQAYHRWIRTMIRDNVPWDRVAREILVSNGSNFRDAPVNFYRAVQGRDPNTIASAVALAFMGARTDTWPKDRLAAMGAFFSQVAYKPTGEWKEEVVYFDPSKPRGTATFPDGSAARIAPGQDPREAFAAWLTAPGNPWFARSLVNRYWFWMLGRGIVHEADDLRPDNPPANPELLAHLEREFVASRYDVKRLLKLITGSATYQLSSVPARGGSGAAAQANFAHALLRPLEAEVLADALCQITGTHEQYASPIPEPYTLHSARPAVDWPRGRQHHERVPRDLRPRAARHRPALGAERAADGGAAAVAAELERHAAKDAAGPRAARARLRQERCARRRFHALPRSPVAVPDGRRDDDGARVPAGERDQPPRGRPGPRVGARQHGGVQVPTLMGDACTHA